MSADKRNERLEAALSAAVDEAQRRMRGIAGHREFAAYAAGFREGWKQRGTRKKKPSCDTPPSSSES